MQSQRNDENLRAGAGGSAQRTQPPLSLDQRDQRDRQRQEARRRFQQARAARENATLEQLEKRGLALDEEAIADVTDDTPRPGKRARLDDRVIHKIYNGDIGPSDTNASTMMGIDKGFTDLRGRFHSLDPFQIPNAVPPTRLEKAAAAYVDRRRQIIAELKASLSPAREPETQLLRFDLIGSICTSADLVVGMCKHLPPRDIVKLYSISKDFHKLLGSFMRSCIMALAFSLAPTSSRIFSFNLYKSFCIPDPAGQAVAPITNGKVGRVPGLKWLQMVYAREKRIRDIIATMARMGHRLGKGSQSTLAKMWLLMDVSTNRGRQQVMSNERLVTDQDLYNAQLFFLKLMMLFNDPVYGPESGKLMHLMLGQRGLSPLWALLRRKRFTLPHELLRAQMRYDVSPTQMQVEVALPVFGVPIEELGVGHFEGWGTGGSHLWRPDDLVPMEAIRRCLDLDKHLDFMMIFGHVGLLTGRNLAPSLDEMYMSDDDLPQPDQDFDASVDGGCGNVPFELEMWQPRLARKARWETLTETERTEILARDEEELNESLDSVPYREMAKDILEQPTLEYHEGMDYHDLQEQKQEPPSTGKGKEVAVLGDAKSKYGDVKGSNVNDVDAMEIDDPEPPEYISRPCSPPSPPGAASTDLFAPGPSGTQETFSGPGPAIRYSSGASTDHSEPPHPAISPRNVSNSTFASTVNYSTADSVFDMDVDDDTADVDDDDVRSTAHTSVDGGEEVEEEEEPENVPSLDSGLIDELDEQADADYDQAELDYNWDAFATVAPLLLAQQQLLEQHEQRRRQQQHQGAIDDNNGGNDGDDESDESDESDGSDMYADDEDSDGEEDDEDASEDGPGERELHLEAPDPQRNPLLKKGETEDDMNLSDVDMDELGNIFHVSTIVVDDDDDGQAVEFDPDLFNYERPVRGKDAKLRGFYRRF